jgi:hypothetical protein
MSKIILGLVVTLVGFNAVAQVPGRFGQGLAVGQTYGVAAPNPVYTVMPLTVECWAKLSSKSAYNILVANEPKHSVTHWELFAEKGNRSSGHLVSCRHSTSGARSASSRSTRGMRRRTELMFQVAMERGMAGPGGFATRKLTASGSKHKHRLAGMRRDALAALST